MEVYGQRSGFLRFPDSRSLCQLIDTADQLQRRDIGLKSLMEAIDTTSAAGCLA